MRYYKYLLKGTAALSILLLVVIIPITTAVAETVGPYNPAVGSNVTGIGTESWVDAQNITTPGSPYASVTLYQGHRYSNYLQASQYGFTIPLDANILGIEVTINRMSSSHNPNVVDNEVRLVKDGARVGDNKASVTPWPTSFSTATYGGPADLWGAVWTPEEINSAGFGAVLAVYRDNNGNNARSALVDSVQISIYYGDSTSAEVACGNGSPMVYGESLTCVATIHAGVGGRSPSGTVNWSSDGSGSFTPNPCTLAGNSGSATCSAIYTPSAVGSGTHLITATYAGDGYFSGSSASQAVGVLVRPISVTANAQSKVYGQADPMLTYQITAGTLVFNDNFSGALNREPGEHVGTYAILQGTLALSANYDLTYVGDFLTITKATPECVIIAYHVTYDALTHTAGGSCTGVFGEQLDGLDLSGTTHTEVGAYPADPWSFTDQTGNYTYASGTVDNQIIKRTITVAADAKSKLVGHIDPPLTYHVTDGSLLAGDAFSGSLSREPGQLAGTYAILQGSLSLPAYYEITFIGADFTILSTVYLLPFVNK